MNLTKVVSVVSAPELLKAQLDLELGRVLIDATQRAKLNSGAVDHRTIETPRPGQGQTFHPLHEMWSARSEIALLELPTNNAQRRADTQTEYGADVVSYAYIDDDAPQFLTVATTLSENRSSANGMTLPHGSAVSHLLSPAWHQQVLMEPDPSKGSAKTERKRLRISDQSRRRLFETWVNLKVIFACLGLLLLAGCISYFVR